MKIVIPSNKPSIVTTNYPEKFNKNLSSYQKEIEPFIRLLVGALKPQKIFLVQHHPAKIYDVIIIVQERNGIKLSYLQPYLNFSEFAREEICCSIYTAGRLNDAFKSGLIYFLINCNHETLIYDDGTKPLPKADAFKVNESKILAKQVFESSFQKARLFFREAQFCAEHCEYQMAIFMLHQCTELTLRAFILTFFGGEQKTHNITTLSKHVTRIAPQLVEFLTPKLQEDEFIFQLLEDSYLKARYDSGFVVNPKDFNILNYKLETLLTMSKNVFETYMKRLDLAQ